MAPEKHRILAEIQRLASDGGRAPGRQLFERETGIKQSDWYPHHWLRWSEALAEAGFAPNQMQAKLDESVIIEKYVALARELGRLPVHGEVRRKAQTDPTFPSHTVFNRFGGKAKLLEAVAAYCRRNAENNDVLALCEGDKPSLGRTHPRSREAKVLTGYVYLIKSGRHYKIGRTNALGRRERELSIKIPVPPKTVHTIETDDPVGVEAYWHKRFAPKRGEGEWFDLSPEDVAAFKRWKRIA